MPSLIDTLLQEMSLEEMPIPSDWDDKIFSPNVPFSKQLKYAKERAKQLGVGSSRVAFLVPYEGRDTVLKIAKNPKGLAQNDHEVGFMFHDYYLTHQLGIVVPGIDYDEKHDKPVWVHTEYARKVKPSEFKAITGGSPVNLVQYAFYEANKPHRLFGNHIPTTYKHINPESEFVQSFVNFISNYDTDDIGVADFQSLSNWGMYHDPKTGKDRLVIIDFGLSSDIWKTYYGR